MSSAKRDVRLTVNGNEYEFSVEVRKTLADFIHSIAEGDSLTIRIDTGVFDDDQFGWGHGTAAKRLDT